MQHAGNAALAAALAPGQVRRFKLSFMVDWAMNGGYAHPNSDMSQTLVEATIDRQLTGNYPAELEVTEGYAAAQASVRLEGNAPDGTPLVRMFSPYSGLLTGTVAAINTPCYLDVIVITSAGPVTIRQFTGVIRYAIPVRSEGAVDLLLRDAAALLQAPMDIAPWAVDAQLRRSTFDPSAADGGTMALSWLIDHVLRRAGWMQGPAWHPNAVMAWTCNGGILPEVGNFATMDAWVKYDYDYNGYLDWEIPHRTPAGQLTEVWDDAPDGQLAFTGIYLPSWLTKTEIQVTSNGHTVTAVNPTTYGSNNSNLLGFSWKVQVDVGQTSIYMSPSEMIVHLEELRHDPTIPTYDKPSMALLRFHHGTGVVTLRFVETGWVKTWEWTATISSTPTRWLTMYAVLRFSSTGITPYLFVNGSPVTLSVVSNPAWPPLAMAYAFFPNVTNQVRLSVYGPTNFAQVFYQYNTLIGGLVAPTYTALNEASVDTSSLRLQWIPKQNSRSAWDLLRDLASADLGVLYVTEQGVPTFENRSAVAARQDPNNPTLRLTLDQIEELAPQTVLESVVNHLTWELVTREAELTTYRRNGNVQKARVPPVFAATKADQFVLAAGAAPNRPITVGDDIMQIQVGSLPVEHRAMGYLLGGGANASWQEWMQYYSPAYFGEGLTGYQPGSRTSPAVQPVLLAGVVSSVVLGWTTGDYDPAHIRLYFSNPTGSQSYFSVDDATPFYNVGGSRVVALDNDRQSIQDNVSIATYGFRGHTLQGGEWIQDGLTVGPLAQTLLTDLAEPHPFLETVEIPGDPRLQLQDVARVDDPDVLGGPIFASVVGIKRKLSKREGLRDALTLRTFGAIGGSWVMDDPDFSVMNVTTIVT